MFKEENGVTLGNPLGDKEFRIIKGVKIYTNFNYLFVINVREWVEIYKMR